MSDATTWAIAYFAARGDAPWRWADDGNVITWADGTTIAFRDEVAVVLEWLVPQGWPPFGALVWLLAACRGKLPPRTTARTDAASPAFAPTEAKVDAQAEQLLLGSFEQRLRAMHAAVENGLAMVAQLPAELRASPKAKAVLAETVFGQMKGSASASLFTSVLEVLRSGVLTDAMLNDPGAPPPEGTREWLVLHEGLSKLAPESLALRLRTGLDVVPRAAELPATPAGRVRALLDLWKTDPEQGGLARLTRDFMAALQLPRRLSEQDDLPIGGFADLSNRGPLDRLLLSELAHDDLTLAVRIALQEALYLRREPPVRQPPGTLAILLDSGVRVWGVPRVLATAVALALVAKSQKHETVAVFRASGAGLAPVDLLAREGVIAHLGTLEPHAHPGAALPAFHAAIEENDRTEAVLITQREVIGDADFRRCLALENFAALYLAVVDRDGSFELLRHPSSGGPLCRTQVRLDDLLPAPPVVAGKKPQALFDRKTYPELPLFLTADPCPLLLPVRGKVLTSVSSASGGGLCVMKDRRLLRWTRDDRGATTIACDLPRGRTIWLGEHIDGKICVVKTTDRKNSLSARVFAADGTLLHGQEWSFSEHVVRAESRGDVLFVIGEREAQAYHLQTGELLGKTPIVQEGSHGRYFRDPDTRWSVLTWNGQSLGLDPVLLFAGVPDAEIVRMFHRQGFEGPWCVTLEGNIHNQTGQVVMRLGPILGFVRVSENGHRLIVTQKESRVAHLVDLTSSKRRLVAGVVSDSDWEWKPQPPTRTVRTQFQNIQITSLPSLRLLKSSVGCAIFLEEGRLTLKPIGSGLGPTMSFERITLPGKPGFSLSVARWPDGRCAWLDDRGILHLRPADRRQPEVSLILSDDHLAGWSSDGLWYGDPFFIGNHPSAGAEDFWLRVGAFCLPTP